MRQIILLTALFMLAGTAMATFELADPANQVYEEPGKEISDAWKQIPEEDMLCTIHMETYKCTCILIATVEEIAIPPTECVARATKKTEQTEP